MPCNVSVRGAFQLTPSVGRATGNHLICVMLTHISTHALHGEGEPAGGVPRAPPSAFQSAISARRATPRILPRSQTVKYFNPRPPRGGRLKRPDQLPAGFLISIHALREEGDTDRQIHKVISKISAFDFNPRPPRGGRRAGAIATGITQQFQSTPSARRATQAIQQGIYNHIISIHALREEGDPSARTAQLWGRNFNPRPPRGGRPTLWPVAHLTYSISIHALREEGDWAVRPGKSWPKHFNPRPPRGGRLRKATKDNPDE